MPLITTPCKHCEKEINFFTFNETRIELAMDKKEQFTKTCKQCNTSHDYHVDDFKAKMNGYVHLFVVLGIFTGSIAFVYFILSKTGFTLLVFGTAPSILYMIYIAKARQRINAFNRTPLKKRLSGVITDKSSFKLK